MLTPEVREILDGTPIAHLATVLPDGAPHAVPLWIATHGDRIAILTGPQSRKARNLRHHPRVAISIAPPDHPFHPVLIRGHVTTWLTGDEAWKLIDEISTKYVGAPYSRDQERVVALITPDHVKVGLG